MPDEWKADVVTFCAVGKTYVYEVAAKTMGAQCDNWLDTPHVEIYEHATPRQALESGCPACIDKVLRILEAL